MANYINPSRSQLARGLRRSSTAARLLRLWVRIPPAAWMSFFCVLSDRGLCDELITRPEESYRLWCVVVCDLETSWVRRLWPAGGCYVKHQTNITLSRKTHPGRIISCTDILNAAMSKPRRNNMKVIWFLSYKGVQTHTGCVTQFYLSYYLQEQFTLFETTHKLLREFA